VIKFTCPSCKTGCSVDDRFSNRKLKCPTCGARVLHLGDSRVELLTAGAVVPPKPAAPSAAATDVAPASAAPPKPAAPSGEATDVMPKSVAPLPPSPPTDELTPLATAVPHSLGELVGASESRQNFYVGVGLLVFFSLVLIVLGFIVGSRLLVVIPIAVLLSAAGLYLWMHTQKLKKRLAERRKK
jgi:hypothetical protein